MVINTINLIKSLVSLCNADEIEWNTVYVPQTPDRDITIVSTFILGENSIVFYSH